MVRVDHFRGFAAYWEIPAKDPTAEHGRWVEAPGRQLFETLRKRLGPNLPILAEDLGVITPDVEELRDSFNFPGMRILQFAFGGEEQDEDYLPENFRENSVAYSGTHDNDTTYGWFHERASAANTQSESDSDRERTRVLEYLDTDGGQIHWDFIEVLLGCPSRIVLFPLQDVLGLGSEARMNLPGRAAGNWSWRFRWEQLTPDLRERLARLTRETGRNR